jgi:hypothetical protein
MALVRSNGDIFHESVIQKGWLKERGLRGQKLAIYLASRVEVPYFCRSSLTQQTLTNVNCEQAKLVLHLHTKVAHSSRYVYGRI